ncbi:transposase [Streptomyces sp. NPDC002701]|uniref:transposase n=1 Tax=Streptomyces sp. NPDC002701 TaxID=3364661 RepID=UPI0036D1FD86
MESTGKKKPRPRRPFTPEFKAEIVELCRRGDRLVGQIAKDFDLTETAVRCGSANPRSARTSATV